MRTLYEIVAAVSVGSDSVNLPNKGGVPANTAQAVLQIAFGFAGAIALLVIVLAGLRFVLSQGDPQKTAQARMAIIYALIGLVVAMLAFSIVTFVVNRV